MKRLLWILALAALIWAPAGALAAGECLRADLYAMLLGRRHKVYRKRIVRALRVTAQAHTSPQLTRVFFQAGRASAFAHNFTSEALVINGSDSGIAKFNPEKFVFYILFIYLR